MLSVTSIAILNALRFRADAKREVCLIPLGSIYWEDEMPDLIEIAKLSEDERNTIWRLFAIRFKIWDGEQLSSEDRSSWDTARNAAPDWALFHRLELSADDRKAREEAEKLVANEFTDFFGGVDRVQLTDKGDGLQEFSVTFDLDRKSEPEA